MRGVALVLIVRRKAADHRDDLLFSTIKSVALASSS